MFRGSTISCSHQQSLSLLTSHPTCVISHFWIIAILVGTEFYLWILFFPSGIKEDGLGV